MSEDGLGGRGASNTPLPLRLKNKNGRGNKLDHIPYATMSSFFYLTRIDAAHRCGTGDTTFRKFVRKNNIEGWPYRSIRQIAKSIEYHKSMALNSSISADEQQFSSWLVSKLLSFFDDIQKSASALGQIDNVQHEIIEVNDMAPLERRAYMAKEMADNPYYLSLNQNNQAEELYRNCIIAMKSEKTNRYLNLGFNNTRGKKSQPSSGASGIAAGEDNDEDNEDNEDEDPDEDDFEEFIASSQRDNNSSITSNININSNNNFGSNFRNDNSSGNGSGGSGGGVGVAVLGKNNIERSSDLKDIPPQISKVDIVSIIVHEQIENSLASIPRLRYEHSEALVLPELKQMRSTLIDPYTQETTESGAETHIGVESDENDHLDMNDSGVRSPFISRGRVRMENKVMIEPNVLGDYAPDMSPLALTIGTSFNPDISAFITHRMFSRNKLFHSKPNNEANFDHNTQLYQGAPSMHNIEPRGHNS